MKEIPLSRGHVALVDDEDYEWLMQWRWNFMPTHQGSIGYARRSTYINRRNGVVLMHREITKAQKGFDVDHRDGFGLNNCKSNLRVCHVVCNRQNSRLSIVSTTKLKGVHFKKRLGKYVVSIRAFGKQIHLGVFVNPIEAAKAYDRAAVEHFGEFARTNASLCLL